MTTWNEILKTSIAILLLGGFQSVPTIASAAAPLNACQKACNSTYWDCMAEAVRNKDEAAKLACKQRQLSCLQPC
jgi:hypothetical protein